MTTPILENTVVEPETIPVSSYPVQIQKLFSRLDRVEQLHAETQKSSDQLKSEIKSLKKALTKHFTKALKSEKSTKRKPCGFAVPTQVSAELCAFMGKSEGELVSRTEATKFLMKYISENQLQNPANKRIIVPDAKLYALLGEESKTVDITHFTIQRFINLHFPKKKA